MTERGIIFNGEMVRAILDGRKTQTRRVMKVQPQPSKAREGEYWFPSRKLETMVHVSDLVEGNSPIDGCHHFFQEHCCPFGKVGDRLWVRETWSMSECFDDCKPSELSPILDINYLEDGFKGDGKARPSSQMPRWASRITLEITDIRVERLHAITLGDICKEIGCGLYDFIPATHGFSVWEDTWILTHGQDSWQSNPFVWVVEFKRVEAA